MFSKDDLNSHYETNTNITLGSTYWIANDTNQDWNVYRLSDRTHTIDSIVSVNPLKVTVNESSSKSRI